MHNTEYTNLGDLKLPYTNHHTSTIALGMSISTGLLGLVGILNLALVMI